MFSQTNDIIAAHSHCADNKAQLQAGDPCGCFYCCRVFDPTEIRAYLNEGKHGTALCPYCGIDSVIGGRSGFPITEGFLREMRDYWFYFCRDGRALSRSLTKERFQARVLFGRNRPATLPMSGLPR